jgi:long-chain fatty acid transport protein
MRYRNAALITSLLIASSPAFAAGFGLREFSATAMGTAYAGSAAGSGDATYLAYNPASSSAVSSLDASVTAMGIFTGSSATYSALTSAGTPAGGITTPKDFVGGALVPSIALRARLTDKLTAGFAAFTPWDLSTNYQTNVAGRYYAEQSKLITANFQPSLAYEIVPGVALSAAVQIEYAKGTLSNAVDVGTIGVLQSVRGSVPGVMDAQAIFTGSNWSTGYVLGAIAHLSDNLVAGVSYSSKIDHDFKGNLIFHPDAAGLTTALSAATGLFTNTPGSAKVTVPAEVHAGAKFDVTPQWDISAELDWTEWTSFKTLTVSAANPVQPPDVTAANWRSTWTAALGATYHDDSPWVYRAGLIVDPTPVPDATVGPRIPDGNRVGVYLGTSYALNDADEISLSGGHLFVDSRSIALRASSPGNALRGTLTGTTSGAANIIGLQFSHRFD